ncbi:Transcription factor [Sesamum angolense]|uniref:Transcription factor n=1 Tax=Sesamum angolense TaxID=2727404 RepID=A0AAE1XA26_9LAMI|nr:Transcription factor [Sesamum angolense]
MRAGKRLLPEMEEYCNKMFGVEAVDIPHEIYTSRSRPFCMDHQLMVSRPTMITTSPYSSSSSSYSSANLSSTILSFSSPLPINGDSVDNNVNQYDDLVQGRISLKRDQRSSVPVRNALQAREHLVAERKRREKIGQLFIALSKLVPGIKKMLLTTSKSSKNGIRSLEIEQVEKCSEDIDNSICKESSNIDESANELAAASAVKVRISDNNVLIKILCKKQGIHVKNSHGNGEMNLCEVDVRVMPFGAMH